MCRSLIVTVCLACLWAGDASALTLRIDPALSYLSFPAKVEALPAGFTPEPGSEAAKLVAIRERLDSEGGEDFERYNRAQELVEEAGLPPAYVLNL